MLKLALGILLVVLAAGPAPAGDPLKVLLLITLTGPTSIARNSSPTVTWAVKNAGSQAWACGINVLVQIGTSRYVLVKHVSPNLTRSIIPFRLRTRTSPLPPPPPPP